MPIVGVFQCIFRILNRHLSRQISVSLVALAGRGGVDPEADERDPESIIYGGRSTQYGVQSDDSPATWYIKKRDFLTGLISALIGYQHDEVHWLGYHAILRLSFLESCFVLAPAGSTPMIRRLGMTWPGC